MPESAIVTGLQPKSGGGDLTLRRIRHITGIQIRNLTPFPVRDAFTSALRQPIESSNLDVGIAEDFGNTLTRVRSRRISNTSTITRRSQKREDGAVEQDIIIPTEIRGRRPSTPRITFANSSTSPSSAAHLSSSKSAHSLRSIRARTNSITSLSSNHRLGSSFQLGPSSSSTFLTNNSQASLEKIICSRLVETFIVLTTPPATQRSNPTADSPEVLPSSPPTSRSAPPSKPTFTPTSTSPRKAIKTQTHTREASTSSLRNNGRRQPNSALPSKSTFRATPKTEVRYPQSTVTPAKASHKKEKSLATFPIELEVAPALTPVTPIYFSPIHKPSINPFFPFDARPGHDIGPIVLQGQILKLEVWGKTSTPHQRESTVLEEAILGTNGDSQGWEMLYDWDVNLNKLIPLPDDLDDSPTQLPSNTLVITLQPPGQRFYLPPVFDNTRIPRSKSPAGYSSDPESELRKVKQGDEDEQPAINGDELASLSRKLRQNGLENSLDSREVVKTVNWQELFKLVTLQSLIVDTRASLDNVVKNIDELLIKDETFSLRRELSEREARIREMRNNHCTVLDRHAQRKQDLAERSQRLAERTEILTNLGEIMVSDSDAAAIVEIKNQRQQLVPVHQQIKSLQTSLISTLSAIFPIELSSPSDLLFTILDVPLPIPVTANDPAPPLTLPERKDVNEETVAAALGYVAQVVHMLAACIGKSLAYPVTCIGSRSLIRDGISAMVGPRMFPLFSRGVDTYRFEYGVFLLNKDIEMLMAERDLRALDMRHTLPNLKNLLLTLSHDDTDKLPLVRHTSSPMSSTTGLETPPRNPSPSNENVTTPTVASPLTPVQLLGKGTAPSTSGATTPTSSTDESRKFKSTFLGFVPFTDFLRVRYPSHSSEKTHRINGSVTPDDAAGDSEEEDRKTICPDGHKESGVIDSESSTEEVIEA